MKINNTAALEAFALSLFAIVMFGFLSARDASVSYNHIFTLCGIVIGLVYYFITVRNKNE